MEGINCCCRKRISRDCQVVEYSCIGADKIDPIKLLRFIGISGCDGNSMELSTCKRAGKKIVSIDADIDKIWGGISRCMELIGIVSRSRFYLYPQSVRLTTCDSSHDHLSVKSDIGRIARNAVDSKFEV